MKRAIAILIIACGACGPSSGRYAGGGATGPHHLSEAEIAAIPNVFPVTLVPPRTAAYQPMYARMKELENPELIGQLVSTLISLGDRRVPVTVEECGDVSAYYAPAKRAVTICYEFIANANRLAGRPESQWFELDQQAAAVLIFTALHEMGHALVDVLGLTIRGSEEDAADQFAFLIMTNARDTELVNLVMRAPAVFFYHHGEEEQAAGGHTPDDVHSASSSRAFEAICLLYGRHRDPALATILEANAADCITHTDDVVATWNDLLAPYTRLDTGRTFGAADVNAD